MLRTSVFALFTFGITVGAQPGLGAAKTAGLSYPGDVVDVSGTVLLRDVSESADQPARINSRIRPDMQVRTAANSELVAYFPREDTATTDDRDVGLISIRIKPFSSVRFPPSSDRSIQVADGGLLLLKRDPSVQIEILVGLYSAAVTGTSLMVETDGDISTIIVMDGNIVITPSDPAVASTASPVHVGSFHKVVMDGEHEPVVSPITVLGTEIQWCLYYPMIVDLKDVESGLGNPWTTIVDYYRKGNVRSMVDLLGQLPENGAGVAESKIAAATNLCIGNLAGASRYLAALPSNDADRLAMETLIAVVQGRPVTFNESPESETPSQLLARSYWHQRNGELEEAVAMTARAVAQSPGFAFAHARHAELLSYFGSSGQSQQQAEQALELAPEYAPALTLLAVLLAASNRTDDAHQLVERARQSDPRYAQAWIVKGLLEFGEGREEEGTRDLMVGTAMQPDQPLARVYLAEALRRANSGPLSVDELTAAIELDMGNPTSYFYRSLYFREENRINESIMDLRGALARDENRRLFRSQRVLGTDHAVRRVNLANIYEMGGLEEWSLKESSRAGDEHYSNSASHLFVADSLDALRDQSRLFLRLDTSWRNEQLLANMLAPPGSGVLPQYGSLQEYSPLLAPKNFAFNVTATAQSDGRYIARGSAFARSGETSISYDFEFQESDGFYGFDHFRAIENTVRLRHELTDKNAVFVQINGTTLDTGNPHIFGPNPADESGATFNEESVPNLLFGYTWKPSPWSCAMFVAGNERSDYTTSDETPSTPLAVVDAQGVVTDFDALPIAMNRTLDTSIRTYFFDAQVLFDFEHFRAISGLRHQFGDFTTDELLEVSDPNWSGVFSTDPASNQTTSARLNRWDLYSYLTFRLAPGLKITGGASFVDMSFPKNFRHPPTVSGEQSRNNFSPKVGLIYQPGTTWIVQGMYSQSLGSVSLEGAYRLEPTQVSGLTQTFRTLIPESQFGSISGQEVEIAAMSVTFNPTDRVSFRLDAANREACSEDSFGIFSRFLPATVWTPDQTPVLFDFRERELVVAAQALVHDNFTVNLRHEYENTRVEQTYTEIPMGVSPLSPRVFEGDSHLTTGTMVYSHQSGLFARTDLIGMILRNRSSSPTLGDEDVFLANLGVGFRTRGRRLEVEVGVLNLFDQSFIVNGLSSSLDLPRERAAYIKMGVNL